MTPLTTLEKELTEEIAYLNHRLAYYANLALIRKHKIKQLDTAVKSFAKAAEYKLA